MRQFIRREVSLAGPWSVLEEIGSAIADVFQWLFGTPVWYWLLGHAGWVVALVGVIVVGVVLYWLRQNPG
jgi:hypothetical protein